MQQPFLLRSEKAFSCSRLAAHRNGSKLLAWTCTTPSSNKPRPPTEPDVPSRSIRRAPPAASTAQPPPSSRPTAPSCAAIWWWARTGCTRRHGRACLGVRCRFLARAYAAIVYSFPSRTCSRMRRQRRSRTSLGFSCRSPGRIGGSACIRAHRGR